MNTIICALPHGWFHVFKFTKDDDDNPLPQTVYFASALPAILSTPEKDGFLEPDIHGTLEWAPNAGEHCAYVYAPWLPMRGNMLWLKLSTGEIEQLGLE